MSGEKSVSGLGRQSCQSAGLSGFKDDKHKPDREKVTSAEEEVGRKNARGKKEVQTAGNRKAMEGCKDSEMSRAKWIKHHQSRMPRGKHLKEKGFQEITQSTAVTAGWSGFFPIGSPALPSFFLFPPLGNFPHPACPGSSCKNIYTSRQV